MASGDAPKWPGPVTFDDNTPKSGYVKIHLKTEELKISGNLFSSKKPNADIKVNIAKDCVSVEVDINDGGPSYLYKKSMPEDINPDKSKHEVKTGRVELTLCKVKDTSWGGHSRYMIQKE